MKVYYEIKPKHYVGGISITIRYPEGSLSSFDKSVIEEKIAEAQEERHEKKGISPGY
jgi:hypothetical protein